MLELVAAPFLQPLASVLRRRARTLRRMDRKPTGIAVGRPATSVQTVAFVRYLLTVSGIASPAAARVAVVLDYRADLAQVRSVKLAIAARLTRIWTVPVASVEAKIWQTVPQSVGAQLHLLSSTPLRQEEALAMAVVEAVGALRQNLPARWAETRAVEFVRRAL